MHFHHLQLHVLPVVRVTALFHTDLHKCAPSHCPCGPCPPAPLPEPEHQWRRPAPCCAATRSSSAGCPCLTCPALSLPCHPPLAPQAAVVLRRRQQELGARLEAIPCYFSLFSPLLFVLLVMTPFFLAPQAASVLRRRQEELGARLEAHLAQAEALRVAHLAETAARAARDTARVREAKAEVRGALAGGSACEGILYTLCVAFEAGVTKAGPRRS